MKNQFIKLSFALCALLFSIQSSFAQNDTSKTEGVTASVSCTSLGELNSTATIQYDVTLENTTNTQYTVDYTVYFKAGSLVLKSHSHSDILIPGESTTNTFETTMSAEDWAKVTLCSVEWSTR